MNCRLLTLTLLALTAAGSPGIAWSFSSGSGLSPPLVHQTLVFVGTEDGRMISLYAYNGEKRWEAHAGGTASFLSAFNGRVVAAFSENLICFEALSGRVLWSVNLGSRLAGPPLAKNGSMFLALRDGRVISLGDSGNRLWERNLGERISAGPALGAGLLVGTWEGNIYVLDPSSGEVERRISLDMLQPVSPDLAAEGDTAYAASGGTLYAFSLSSGGILWKRDFGSTVTSLSLQGDGIYIGVSESILLIGREDSRTVWSVNVGSRPLVLSSDGQGVVAGTADGRMVCLDNIGNMVWEVRTGVLTSSPVLAHGKVFATTSDGRLICVGSWGTTGHQDGWKGYVFLALALLCWGLFLSVEVIIPEKRRPRRVRRGRTRRRSRSRTKRA